MHSDCLFLKNSKEVDCSPAYDAIVNSQDGTNLCQWILRLSALSVVCQRRNSVGSGTYISMYLSGMPAPYSIHKTKKLAVKFPQNTVSRTYCFFSGLPA